ncbi:DUF317 domain-containing protein [Streptomyces sp. NPDC001219]
MRHRLEFDPQSATSAWWRLRAETTDTEPGWYAEFGGLVPAEVLASLTDALIAAPTAQQPDPFHALVAAGWLLNEATATSADGMCHVERRTDQEDSRGFWRVEACQPGYGTPMGPRIWHAWFDARVPDHLVGAFITALADPAPLQRAMFDRTAHYSAVQKPSPLTPQQVVDAHVTRLDALRARARAARRSQGPAVATAPALPTPHRPARRS